MRSENAFRVKSYYQTRLFFEKLIQKSNYDKYRSPLIKETMIFVAHNALAFTRIVSLSSHEVSGVKCKQDQNYYYRVTIKERYNVERNCGPLWNFGKFLCLCGAHQICSI